MFLSLRLGAPPWTMLASTCTEVGDGWLLGAAAGGQVDGSGPHVLGQLVGNSASSLDGLLSLVNHGW